MMLYHNYVWIKGQVSNHSTFVCVSSYSSLCVIFWHSLSFECICLCILRMTMLRVQTLYFPLQVIRIIGFHWAICCCFFVLLFTIVLASAWNSIEKINCDLYHHSNIIVNVTIVKTDSLLYSMGSCCRTQLVSFIHFFLSLVDQ